MTIINSIMKTDEVQLKKIWNLALPVIIGQVLHTFMVIADMFFIAKLGSLETSAVTAATSVIGVIHVIPFLIASGSIALVSRLTGADDREGIKEISLNGIILSLIVGVIVTLVSYLNLNLILKIFGGAEAEVLSLSKVYIRIALLGIPLFFFNATTKAVLQATGDTKNPVKVFIGMNVLNIFLDYLFIMVLKTGIGGAAWATAISEAMGALFMGYLVINHIFKFDFKDILDKLTLKLKTSARIMKIGGFSALHMITRPLTGLIMYRIVISQGVSAGAAFGIGGRLFNFVFIFLAGLGTAMSVLVGQNLGKADIEAAEGVVKQGLKLAIYNIVIFSVPFFIFPKYLMRAFIDDPEVIRIGVEYLRICYMGILFVIFPNIMGAAFQGAGDTLPPMVASVGGNWFVKIPFAYLLTTVFPMGTTGVWIAISASVVVEAIIILVWFYMGNWKKKVI
ncbi:MATE family efflux transporter [Alkaliphilus transvaalensis]|uniref:MATE family efflux transporter n=1 Tax=Alkaliphilus transvaalensis TaxID=114628 RepID=UPI0006886C1F|nr:MATE family efflux transporter [Alkaliphilus transvaalensis]